MVWQELVLVVYVYIEWEAKQGGQARGVLPALTGHVFYSTESLF